MNKFLRWVLLPYIILIAIGNYYVNGPMEKKINKRRNYLTTELAISFFPSVFYVKNLKYNLYAKKFTIKHTVSKSIIVINPLALLHQKVSVLSASGWDVDFALLAPEPIPVSPTKRKWSFDLNDVTLRNLNGAIFNHKFKGPRDTLKLSIYIPPQGKGNLEFKKVRWRARNSYFPENLASINGVGYLQFTGNLTDFMQKAILDLNYNIKIQKPTTIPKLGAISDLIISQGKLSLNLKLDKGQIDKTSFAKITNAVANFKFKKWWVQLFAQGKWSKKKQTINLKIPKLIIRDLDNNILLTSRNAAVTLITKESGLTNWANKQDISILLPIVKMPYLSHWTKNLSSDLASIKGNAKGSISLSTKAGDNKSLTTKITAVANLKEIKIKKTYFSGKFNITSELAPVESNPQISTGFLDIDSMLEGEFADPIYPVKEQTVKIRVNDLTVNTKTKTTTGVLFTELQDTRQALNFIYDNFSFPKLIAFLFVQEQPTFAADIKVSPGKIDLLDTRAVIKKHHRILSGDWHYEKKNGKPVINGEGNFKFNIFNIKFKIKDNELDLF